MHDDGDRGPELSPPPATPAIVRRVAPVVVAALIGAGCGDPGDPLGVHDAGISLPVDGGPDAGPAVYDAGVADAGPIVADAGPIVADAGIAPPSDSGASE